jgi:hypothetical protein
LSITNLGSLMTLSWSDGILQQASNVSGPWSDVPEALPPTYSTPASAGAGFYRLRCNAP